VRAQGFTEDQKVGFSLVEFSGGIEGRTMSCGPRSCNEAPTTPFASTLYGDKKPWGNDHPGWE
jgi:hypothetical protein